MIVRFLTFLRLVQRSRHSCSSYYPYPWPTMQMDRLGRRLVKLTSAVDVAAQHQSWRPLKVDHHNHPYHPLEPCHPSDPFHPLDSYQVDRMEHHSPVAASYQVGRKVLEEVPYHHMDLEVDNHRSPKQEGLRQRRRKEEDSTNTRL